MASPSRRTWLLRDLDREVAWRLWFDVQSRRWEVQPLGAPASTGHAGPPPASAKREDGVSAPRAVRSPHA